MNKDLISRSALSEKLQAHHDFFVNAWGGFSNLPTKDKARVDEITHCIAEVMNAPAVDAVDVSDIDNAPTIEAEPVRHGVWVCGDYYDVGDVCSECDWDSGMVNPTLRYCPNCGTKMDLES